jgi:hypothetical protein
MDAELLNGILLWLTPVFYGLGLLTAIVWPYFNAKKENPAISFDWGYAKWQIAAAVVGLLPTLAGAISIGQLEAWAGQGVIGLILAFSGGFAFARGGREVQKTAGK